MSAGAGPKVTIGVCGGVAAYKAVELVRALQDAGFDPHVVMTAAAEEFVRPLAFAAISGHTVITSLWSGGAVPEGTPGSAAASSVEHIEQAQTTRALVVVPATANVIGKMANGIADDFLTTMYLALPRGTPVIVAPAMNVAMWEHPAVRANVQTLIGRGVRFVTPGTGYLACGMEGSGRLAGIAEIVDAVRLALGLDEGDRVAGSLQLQTPPFPIPPERMGHPEMSSETVLVTAGGTREPLDGVRFLGNRSSGRMGYALAEAAVQRGARVILVSAATGLPVPAGVRFYPVATAAEMQRAVMDALPGTTVVLKAAAVADFRPASVVAGKIAREGGLTLELEPTEDIAAEVVKRRDPGTLVIAFSAEMDGGVERARAKMLRKGVDAMVVNDVSEPAIGFDSERNAATMLVGDRSVAMPEMTKREMAECILDEVLAMRRGLP